MGYCGFFLLSGDQPWTPWLVGLVTLIVVLLTCQPLASVEINLLLLLPAAAGLWWAQDAVMFQMFPPPAHGVTLAVMAAVAVALIYGRYLLKAELARFRGCPERPSTSRGTLMLGALLVLTFGTRPFRPTELYATNTLVWLAASSAAVAAFLLIPPLARLILRRSDCGGAPRLYHLLGGAWCLMYLLAIHFILLAVLAPLSMLLFPRNRGRRARALRSIAQPVLAGLVRTFPYGKVVCRGIAPGAFTRPAIVISNHQSIVDIPLLSRIPCDLRLTIKGQWWTHPLIGAGVKVLNHVRVEPGDPEATLRQAAQAFAEGSSIHVFPEGTRVRGTAPARFHKGAFELAIQSNADILPLVLCDTWTCLPRGGTWVEYFRMSLDVLPRITPATFDYALGAKALARHAESLVYQAWVEALRRNNTPSILRRKVARLYRYQGAAVERRVDRLLQRPQIFVALDQALPNAGLILDLACGYGVAAHWLSQAGPERTVLGIDDDPEKIRVAQCSAHEDQPVSFETRDVHSGSLPACQAILVLGPPGSPAQADTALLRARDALTPGGRLILQPASGRDAEATAATQAQAARLRGLGFTAVTTVDVAQDEGPLLVAYR